MQLCAKLDDADWRALVERTLKSANRPPTGVAIPDSRSAATRPTGGGQTAQRAALEEIEAELRKKYPDWSERQIKHEASKQVGRRHPELFSGGTGQ